MENEKKVILVDKNDNVVGECSKLLAHQTGQLHRAFSVFIFNDQGEMCLQQRALENIILAGSGAMRSVLTHNQGKT